MKCITNDSRVYDSNVHYFKMEKKWFRKPKFFEKIKTEWREICNGLNNVDFNYININDFKNIKERCKFKDSQGKCILYHPLAGQVENNTVICDSRGKDYRNRITLDFEIGTYQVEISHVPEFAEAHNNYPKPLNFDCEKVTN